MPENTGPVRWTGRQAVVTLPECIDRSNADQVREQLLLVINRRTVMLIADLARPSPAITPARMPWRAPAGAPSRAAPTCGWWSSLMLSAACSASPGWTA